MGVGRPGREQAFGGAGQLGVAAERRLAQGGGRRVQQAVGQGVGEELQDLVRVAPAGQLLAGAGEQFVAGVVAQHAVPPDGHVDFGVLQHVADVQLMRCPVSLK